MATAGERQYYTSNGHIILTSGELVKPGGVVYQELEGSLILLSS